PRRTWVRRRPCRRTDSVGMRWPPTSKPPPVTTRLPWRSSRGHRTSSVPASSRTSNPSLRSDEPVASQPAYEPIPWARVLLAEGGPRVTEALDLLDRVLDDAQEAGRHGTVVDALVARALAHAALEHRDAAVADVSRAVTTGVPAGYRRIFLDEGAPMQELLRAVPREPGAP